MDSNSNPKPWWHDDLELSLGGTTLSALAAGQRMIRNIPSALAAHHLSQPSPVDTVQPDPVEKMKALQGGTKVPRPAAKVNSPPPKPACLEPNRAETPKANPPAVQHRQESVINMPPPKPQPPEPQTFAADQTEQSADKNKFTLEQLLDPDFCGYAD